MNVPKSLNLDEAEPDQFLVAMARLCEEAHASGRPVVARVVFGGIIFQVLILNSDGRASQNAPKGPRPPAHELSGD